MTLEQVEVRVRDCACPNHAHNGTGDLVYLRAKPSVALGLAVEGDIIAASGSDKALQRAWFISYIRHGVVGWNLVDAKGQPRDLDIDELLDDWEVGMAVAEKADELYGDRVVTPLVGKLYGTSEPGQTSASDKDSTSPEPESTPSPSEPSSPATTAATKRSKR
jgi:hypothetical protein